MSGCSRGTWKFSIVTLAYQYFRYSLSPERCILQEFLRLQRVAYHLTIFHRKTIVAWKVLYLPDSAEENIDLSDKINFRTANSFEELRKWKERIDYYPQNENFHILVLSFTINWTLSQNRRNWIHSLEVSSYNYWSCPSNTPLT